MSLKIFRIPRCFKPEGFGRGIKVSEEWRNVAEFLWKNENEWPQQPTDASEVLLDSDEGVKRAKTTVGAALVQKDFWSSPVSMLL